MRNSMQATGALILPEETVHKARLKVCDMSESAEEARELMMMLGLL